MTEGRPNGECRARRWIPGLVMVSMLGAGAEAAPFGSFDARTLGMGDAGVASGTIGAAAYHNPALLAAQRREDDFNLKIPIAGLQVGDAAGLRSDTQRFKDAYDAGDNAAALAALNAAAGKSLLAEGRLAAVIGFAAAEYGAALVINGYTQNSARVLKGGDLVSFSDSAIELVGINGYEIGVALANGVGAEHRRLAFGVVPKYVRLRSNDFTRPLTDFSGDDRLFAENAPAQTARGRADLDVGLSIGAVRGWRFGLTGRNLFARDLRTVSGRVISLDPQWRAGLAYAGGFFRLAIDLDLVENTALSAETPTRWLALGGEINIFNFAQFRLGWRRNHADIGAQPVLEQYTAGLGAMLWGLQADLAVIANDNAKGGMLQLGLRY